MMKIVPWEFKTLTIPMIQDQQGDLYCTTPVLMKALNTTRRALDNIRRRHPEEFSDLRSTNSGPKEDFLRANKSALGIRRLRADMLLWSEDDMIAAAILTRSDVSRELRSELRALMKAQAKVGMVSEGVVEDLRREFSEQMHDMRLLILQLAPVANQVASSAGTLLAAQKRTKPLRDLAESGMLH